MKKIRTRDGKDVENLTGRRAFLQQCGVALSGITIIGTAAPLISGCDTSLEPRDPNQNGGGNNNGGDGLVFDVSALSEGEGFVSETDGPDGFPILIAMTGAEAWSALSTRCTHQGCEVRSPSNGTITCPCHGSQYALDGTVLQGPAPDPLPSYEVTVGPEAGQITVTTE